MDPKSVPATPWIYSRYLMVNAKRLLHNTAQMFGVERMLRWSCYFAYCSAPMSSDSLNFILIICTLDTVSAVPGVFVRISEQKLNGAGRHWAENRPAGWLFWSVHLLPVDLHCSGWTVAGYPSTTMSPWRLSEHRVHWSDNIQSR